MFAGAAYFAEQPCRQINVETWVGARSSKYCCQLYPMERRWSDHLGSERFGRVPREGENIAGEMERHDVMVGERAPTSPQANLAISKGDSVQGLHHAGLHPDLRAFAVSPSNKSTPTTASSSLSLKRRPQTRGSSAIEHPGSLSAP